MVTVTALYRKGRQVLKNDFTENSNGTIHFFDAGTTNPQTVYSDAAGTAALGTSVTLDSDGRTQTAIYISTTGTKVEHRDSEGNVIFPAEDNIPGAAESVSNGYARPETPTNIKNTSGTIDASDASEVFLCDATSADVTLTLVNSSSYGDGHPLTFIRTDNSAYKVTIESSGSETLNEAGDTSIVLREQGDAVTLIPDGANFHTKSEINRNNRLPQGYKSGCELSLGSDANHEIVVAAGEWRDSTNTFDLVLASALTKLTTENWAAGDEEGGLDTGSVAATTLYYVHLIGNPTTGVRDVLYSISKTSPNLPSGYTKFRCVGFFKTNGSADIDFYISYILNKNGRPDLILQFKAGQGNNGGSALTGGWRNITLNDTKYDKLEISGVVRSGSTFNLPAGTYIIKWWSPSYGAGTYATRLKNNTDNSFGYSRNSFSGSSQVDCHGYEIVSISGTKNFQIEYLVSVATGGSGLGVARNIGGVDELYNLVEITKIDTEH